MTVKEIAELLNGKVVNGDINTEINSVAKIEEAQEGTITFIANSMYEKFYSSTKASAIVVSHTFKPVTERGDISLIKVDDPYLSFLELLNIFAKDDDNTPKGISKYSITSGSEIGEDTYIGDFTYIAPKCKIGNNNKIYPNCTIGAGVTIGNNCIIYPNTVIYYGCKIGNDVIIHSGTVIGSDGFGQARNSDGTYTKIPQNGIVVIEDDVEIGSNCSIDRATMGETRICKGVKLDNQIQIAHNCYIGENTVIAAHVGLSGSTKVGKRCMIGGKSSTVGHLSIADDVIIGGATNVSKSITKPGMYTGYRARPSSEDMRHEAIMRTLDKRVKQLEEEIRNLKANK